MSVLGRALGGWATPEGRARAVRPLWRNPVVVRDLRVRMRGSRTYWHQALYLALLGLLTMAGYSDASSATAFTNAAQMQDQLQEVYYYIFLTMAFLLCLIAPALTAASITSERQRLTMDLLVTTPLSAAELLMGKLLSSIAFVGLLLMLSLPASTLCVIFGGATLGDVLRVYVLLAVDGLVLAAIGLLFSCLVKDSLSALVWTYFAVGAFCIGTASGFTGAGPLFGMGPNVKAEMAIAAMNPFVAVTLGAGSFEVLGVDIPLWVGTSVFAFVTIRLLVTLASYRMGTYGEQHAASLRRQLLFVSALTAFTMLHSRFYAAGAAGVVDGRTVEVFLIGCYMVAFLFLASLFTPDRAAFAARERVPWYRPLDMFSTKPGGALPFFHAWLVTLGGSAVLAGWAARATWAGEWPRLLLTPYYLSGMGFLFWAMARVLGRGAATLGAGRGTVSSLYFLLAFGPVMVFSMLDQAYKNSVNWNPLMMLWLFYPLLKTGASDASNALLWSGTLFYGVGLLALVPWRVLVRRRPAAAASAGP